MIGVIADSAEQDVVREFFELFKTPWEFYRKDRRVRGSALCRRRPVRRNREGCPALCRQKDAF